MAYFPPPKFGGNLDKPAYCMKDTSLAYVLTPNICSTVGMTPIDYFLPHSLTLNNITV